MVTRTSLLADVIDPGQEMTPELARYFLVRDFTAAQRARYSELSAKAQRGDLSEEEHAELEEFLDVDDVLSMLRSKARVVLKQSSAA